MRVNFLTYIVQLFFLAGLTLLLVFIVLSGSINHFPINKFYWIQADTSNIGDAPDVSRWTFWGLNTVKDGKNVKKDLSPAYPFSPADDFSTTINVPKDFVDNRNTYYYLSRFAFVFFWIALAFTGVSLIISIFSVFSYSILKVNSWLTTIAFIFIAGAVSFMTAATVMGKNAFKKDNRSAHLGAALYGIAWASVAISIILFFISWGELIAASYKKHKNRVQTGKGEEAYIPQESTEHTVAPAPAGTQGNYTDEDPYAQQKQGTLNNESGIKFFKIRRHHKDDTDSV